MQKAELYQLDKSKICRSDESQLAFSEGKVELRFINNASSLIKRLTTHHTTLKCLVLEEEEMEGLLLSVSPAGRHAIVHILVLASPPQLSSSHDSG